MKKKFEIYKNLALISQIGITMVVHIVLGMIIGGFADSIFKTRPFIMLVCVFVFMFAGFISIYKLSVSNSSYQKSSKRTRRDR